MRLGAYPDSLHAYKVMLAKPAMAALWVDQYTGEVIGRYERPAIFKLASAAHRRLFGKTKAEGAFGAKTGKLIIGITSIALLMIILSGLIIWWPAKGEFRKKFKISTSKGSYKFWYDSHHDIPADGRTVHTDILDASMGTIYYVCRASALFHRDNALDISERNRHSRPLRSIYGPGRLCHLLLLAGSPYL